MKIKTKDGTIHTVVCLDLEDRTINGYVCDDGNTYPAGECELIRPEPKYKKAWRPAIGESYFANIFDRSIRKERFNFDDYDFDTQRIDEGNVYKDEATARLEYEYFSALRRIRNVIRENDQFASFDDKCCCIWYRDIVFIIDDDWRGEPRSIGGIYVKDADFAQWLIENYSDDLKILAGIKEA